MPLSRLSRDFEAPKLKLIVKFLLLLWRFENWQSLEITAKISDEVTENGRVVREVDVKIRCLLKRVFEDTFEYFLFNLVREEVLRSNHNLASVQMKANLVAYYEARACNVWVEDSRSCLPG